MQLSAPIYVLKRKAKLLTRGNGVSLHQALNRVAVAEGFTSWSHLVSSSASGSPARKILSLLESGDLALIGARPGHGKTLLGLELVAKASQFRRKGFFFTLDYHERDIADRFSTIGMDPSSINKSVVIDTSDYVSADYIINRLEAEKEPALVVVDYLQLLDQKRSNPSLDDQIKSLQRYVIGAGAICAVISQIDRSFDLVEKSMPDISDVRLPNPLDMSVFSKSFFLHHGKIRFDQAA
ncbi:DNA helicase [Oceaniradius stylonematis]|jgi:replicative DNA helicase|uniref:DNA helicase n=1 Tax=Oceaniradius stylonematis TaxID=2184161 RepID=A0A3A8AGH9_9HYPH|nr:DNA helicase [Oceaniradius stylonematis]RKF08468.1 DNA helicase [Oceaniradius stylonematis]